MSQIFINISRLTTPKAEHGVNMNQKLFLEMKLGQIASHMSHMEEDELYDKCVHAIHHQILTIADCEGFAPNKYLVEFGENGCYLTTDPNGHYIPLPFQQCGYYFTKDEADYHADMINLLMGMGTVRVVQVENAYESALDEVLVFKRLGLHGFHQYENDCSAAEMIKYATACSLLQGQRGGSKSTRQTKNPIGCLVWIFALPGFFMTIAALVN